MIISIRTKQVRIIDTLSKSVYSFSQKVNQVFMFMILILMLLIVADVFLRYVFNMPIMGGADIVRILMVITIFGSCAYTMVIKGHTNVDIVVSRLSIRKRAILEAITCFLSLGFFGLVIWRNIVQAQISWMNKITTVELTIPIFPFRLFVVFGIILLCLVLIIKIIEAVKQASKQ